MPQGNIIIIAVGLVIALAFSTLIKAFTDNIITPLVNSAGSGGTTGLGFHVNGQLVNVGAFIAAVIYFIIFMAVIYFAIVVPYRTYQKRRGVTVFGDPPPAKSCPDCLSEDFPVAATKSATAVAASDLRRRGRGLERRIAPGARVRRLC